MMPRRPSCLPAVFALVLLLPAVSAQAQVPTPSVSLTGGDFPHELKVDWTWSAGDTDCNVDDYSIEYKKSTVATWNTSVIDDMANDVDAGVYSLQGSFGSATSISSSFTIGPRASGIYSADGEGGVTLADVDYDVRLYVYSENCSDWSSSSNVATGKPTMDVKPSFADDDDEIDDLTLIQNSPMTAVNLPEATGGNRGVYYSISPDLPAGLSAVQSTRVLSGTPTGIQDETEYTYKANDRDYNQADSDADKITFKITVAADTVPSFGSSTIANQSLTQNSAMTDLTLPAATGGNGTLSYAISPALPTGLTFTASTRVLSGTPTGTSASATYTYTVTDGDGNTASTDAATLTFTIAVAAEDSAPSFGSSTIADLSLTQNSAMTAVTLPEATGGNEPLSYSLSPALPTGLTFTASTRVLSGTPTGTSASTTYTYTVTDADSDTATLTFTIAVAAEDTAPSFGSSTIADLSLTQNAAMTAVTLPEATGGNGTLSYSISPALPAGLSFTASTRVLSGTPTGTSASATYTYTVSDEDTDTDTLTFTIVVAAAPEPPPPPPPSPPPPVVDTAPAFVSGASIADLDLTQNIAMSDVTLPAASGGDGTLSYAISPALPAGLSFNASTRVLGGTPTGSSASVEYTYTVSDGDNNTADEDKDTLTFTIAVAADTAPAFANSASIADLSLTQDTAMDAVTLPAASGGDGTLSYAISPALPAGLSFSASTRVLSGTPTETSARTAYTYTVSDGDGNTADSDEASLTFTITVEAATPVPALPLAGLALLALLLWRVGASRGWHPHAQGRSLRQ